MKNAPLTSGTAIEILEAALAREEEAHEFYKQALVNAPSNFGIQQLLHELADMEYKHAAMVRDKLRELQRY